MISSVEDSVSNVGSVADACRAARSASRLIGRSEAEVRTRALLFAADMLRRDVGSILQANALDMAKGEASGLSPAMLDRLLLNPARVEAMAAGVAQVAELPDPLGTVLSESIRPNGLIVRRVRVPIGVVGMIYESRPNVTADASALLIKAGNAAVLRGGSEAIHSNEAIAAAIHAGLEQAGLPRTGVQLLPTGREAIKELVQQSETVDLVIPRGGEALIRFVDEHARVPVIKHYKGVCHLYIDEGADSDTATKIAVNAKLQRPGVCNAVETILLAEADAARLVPQIANALIQGGCEVRGDARVVALAPLAVPASPGDFGYEFLAPVVAMRVVSGIDGALAHIEKYGSGHTEAIVSPDAGNQERFRREVDASCVVVNASTRFHDGFELGLGAEIGIATSRLHWRGVMGLESLTTMKWVLEGSGQVRG